MVKEISSPEHIEEDPKVCPVQFLNNKELNGVQETINVKNTRANGEVHIELPESKVLNGNAEEHIEENGVQSPVESESSTTTNGGLALNEFPLIEEANLSLKILLPNASEPFDIDVSSMEVVQELHQILNDKEDTCHRTCFSLYFNGLPLDNFAEIRKIPGLQDGSLLKLIEEPYTVREARIHLRHVRDLIRCLDVADAFNAVDCNSISVLNGITEGDIFEKKLQPEEMNCTPPECILPGASEVSLSFLIPQAKESKPLEALKLLTSSSWNPPPGNRKLRGDLLYLFVVSLEDKKFHITVTPNGFYVNQSSEEEFDPKPVNIKQIYHSLVDLLNQISPLFKKNFAAIQKKRTNRHAYERVATPYQVFSWTSPLFKHTQDSIRAEDAFTPRLGHEEHVPNQVRDWNDEMQQTRELPKRTLAERILRERSMFKVHGDFVAASIRGAMAVIDGHVMPINPGEQLKMQMYLWNNIFFSLGFDVKDHYKELGGDIAAYYAPNNDLQGVRAYNNLDMEKLFTLGTVVLDYRGYRVTAQSIVPGILDNEQDKCVIYGSIDFGKTVVGNPKYVEMLEKPAETLKILPHKVVNNKGETVELHSSVECKGILGNDGRYYILDLLRTFPPDVNFLITEDPLSDAVKELGFPIEHRHKLCCLRKELVDTFVENRYMTFIKLAAYHFQQLGQELFIKKKVSIKQEGTLEAIKVKEEVEEPSNTDDNSQGLKELIDALKTNEPSESSIKEEPNREVVKQETIPELTNGDVENSISHNNLDAIDVEQTKKVLTLACKAVKSLHDTEFVIRFNTDVYSPLVTHAVDPENPDRLSREKELIRDAAEFLVLHQIPKFINECKEFPPDILDGKSLSEALHNKGINMRYLGKVTQQLSNKPSISYLHSIAVMELISRSCKHLFNVYIQSVTRTQLSPAICHFLNCLLTTCPNLPLSPALDERKMKKNKGKKKHRFVHPLNKEKEDSQTWTSLSPKTLWENLKAELMDYYHWELRALDIDSAVELYKFQKISLLRAFCQRNGIQILLRDYKFEGSNRAVFTQDDILNVFPVTKHYPPKPSDAYNFYTTGQTKIGQGQVKEGLELISEAYNLLNNVYGTLHPEIAQCMRTLARLNYLMGDYVEALNLQQRAVLMCERVNGIDHTSCINEYVHFALYCFANTKVTTAIVVLYRARYLALLAHGEAHPEVAVIDSNIGLILHALGQYELSLRFLESALKLNKRFYGSKNIKVAINYHLVARTQSCMGDFRGALSNEKETYQIYKLHLGEEHEKTRESSECLSHLTQQAVTLQRKINERGTPGLLPPIQIQTPTIQSVLEMLNIINGIFLIQISPEDLETIRADLERQQRLKEESTTATPTSEDEAAR